MAAVPPEPTPAPPAAWQRFADLLLREQAALCAVVVGVPPRRAPAPRIDHPELDGKLRALPGWEEPAEGTLDQVRAAFAPALSAARAELAAEAADGRGVLPGLARRLGLSPLGVQTLALLAAVELDRQRQRAVGFIQDSPHPQRLTLESLQRMLGTAAEVAPDAPLRRAELVLIDQTGPWATRFAAIPDQLAWALAEPAEPSSPRAAPREPREPRRLLVTGADPDSRLAAARRAWSPDGPPMHVRLPADETGRADLAREAVLSGGGVVLDLDRPLTSAEARWIERADFLDWALSSRGEQPLDTLPAPPPGVRWQELRVDGVPRGELNLEQQRLVGAVAGAGVRRLAGGHLDGLAVRVRPQRGWDDLVLPPDQQQQLRELVDRHRLRDRVHRDWGFPAVPSAGVVALFAGPSGTGKTLAAEVVAASLGLDLYKVDLSAVVSKYIGETEKNLDRIFDAAAAGEQVLFFDEADALFGKRSEVADAHDRYANIEVAYLLQRLETYDGTVILATNLQRNMDQAFARRIAVAIDFAAPETDQRRAIWERSFPPTAPVGSLDLDFLAQQFKVTGGVIRNAALAAAFLAAAQGQPVITMEHVALALNREFGKLGRLRTEAEFERYFDLVNQTPGPDQARGWEP